MSKPSRRQLFVAAAASASLLTPRVLNGAESKKALLLTAPNRKPAVRYCLNTSTIRGKRLPLDEIVEIASEAGYDGIEPWISEIVRYRDGGGSLDDLRKRIADRGLVVESAIGFANWIVDDEVKRKQALDQARKDMELVRSIGGKRIAAPPSGTRDGVDLDAAAERYAALLKVGRSTGVLPQLELWGFSKPINRIGKLAYIAAEAGDPSACLLPDVYHIYKGGSDFAGLNLLNGKQIHVFHINDYPKITRDKIGDGDRVYPGDGVAPLDQIMKTLFSIGFEGGLSLELFNRDYWKQEPLQVAKTGLAKMKKMVDASTGTQK